MIRNWAAAAKIVHQCPAFGTAKMYRQISVDDFSPTSHEPRPVFGGGGGGETGRRGGVETAPLSWSSQSSLFLGNYANMHLYERKFKDPREFNQNMYRRF